MNYTNWPGVPRHYQPHPNSNMREEVRFNYPERSKCWYQKRGDGYSAGRKDRAAPPSAILLSVGTRSRDENALEDEDL